MAHGTSAMLAAVLAIVVAGATIALKESLADSKAGTIAAGFLSSNVFLMLLTVRPRTHQAASNAEMELLGPSFQTRLLPEVAGAGLVAVGVAGCVHRVSMTTCVLFSCALLVLAVRAGNARYAVAPVPVASVGKKRR